MQTSKHDRSCLNYLGKAPLLYHTWPSKSPNTRTKFSKVQIHTFYVDIYGPPNFVKILITTHVSDQLQFHALQMPKNHKLLLERIISHSARYLKSNMRYIMLKNLPTFFSHQQESRIYIISYYSLNSTLKGMVYNHVCKTIVQLIPYFEITILSNIISKCIF